MQDAIDAKYPNISYIICFIIPNQQNTQYYKNLDNRTFLFTLKNFDDLCEYKVIYNLIINENLFINIPISNNIEISNSPSSSSLWWIGDLQMVHHIEK